MESMWLDNATTSCVFYMRCSSVQLHHCFALLWRRLLSPVLTQCDKKIACRCIMTLYDVCRYRTTRCSSSRKTLNKASPSTASIWRKSTITRRWNSWVSAPANWRLVHTLKYTCLWEFTQLSETRLTYSVSPLSTLLISVYALSFLLYRTCSKPFLFVL